MAEPERRRRRPAVSCSLCRKRKIRCNRETPCSNCLRSRNNDCVYEIHPSPPWQQNAQTGGPTSGQQFREPYNGSIDGISSSRREPVTSNQASLSSVPSSTTVSTPISTASARELESMKNKIRQLEEQLSRTSPAPTRSYAPTPNSHIETVSSAIGGTIHIHHEEPLIGHAQAISHKNRVFGRSHWINGALLARDTFLKIEPYIGLEPSKSFLGIQKCKSLARIIKTRRAPSWPSPSRSDLPSKDVADSLISCYLRTFERIYRVLHVPSFKKEYEALWLSDAEPDAAFLVQLKLVLAIGTTIFDEHFSMRASAVRWVYDAQAWSSEPGFKQRLNLQTIQIDILLLLARETAGVGWDLVWVSAGTLYRKAVFMGLHKDPVYLPKTTRFFAEMRRRLWNTVLEISLQSSLASGAPPLLNLTDFDTEPPGNFDDDQLREEGSLPKAEDDFSNTSMAIAMRRSFPIRLAVAKFLNDVGTQSTYEETLRYDAELRASYKSLRQTLQELQSKPGEHPSQFEMRVVDSIMCRYISVLHVPYFGAALQGTSYAYSRRVVLETSLKTWCTAFPSSTTAGQFASDVDSLLEDDFTRLTSFGSSFFRTSAFHSCVLIMMELKAQLEEEESLGPVPLRPDLFSVIEVAKEMFLRSVAAGDTNIKGYLLLRLIAAHIEALMQGVEKEKFGELILKAVEDATDQCLPILEQMAAQIDPSRFEENLNQMSLNTPSDAVEDWDFMMSDAQFNLDNTDLIGWLVNDGALQTPPIW